LLNRLYEIVLGKRGITADTALRLARLLKTSAQFWMRLQADWDLHQAMQRSAQRRREHQINSGQLNPCQWNWPCTDL
jgi:plasmid maintenance system antidote protein VapI